MRSAKQSSRRSIDPTQPDVTLVHRVYFNVLNPSCKYLLSVRQLPTAEGSSHNTMRSLGCPGSGVHDAMLRLDLRTVLWFIVPRRY